MNWEYAILYDKTDIILFLCSIPRSDLDDDPANIIFFESTDEK